ncbi:MAG: flotillin family protein [Actinobacteria bacterium]|nr:flotillin family protein [Actinomycetota bacterium]
MDTWIWAGIGLTIIVVFVILLKVLWRVAEPNEAMVISGLGAHGGHAVEGMNFRIITGGGALVIPAFQVVRRLSLDLREADLAIECVTHQGIPLGIRGVVIYKVGDDTASIANAARRFLDQQADMNQRVHNVFSGHLRAIVGNMTVEEMIRDREKLTELTRASSGTEMEKLGLIVDSLQIQEIDDPTGYITNLGRPHAAAVESQARIAQAEADEAATKREQEADARKANARRDSQVQQAAYSAEINEAAAKARQAGPKSEAQAIQEVVVEQTKVAELEAQREEQRLQAAVRKPADAKAYEMVTLARGDRDAKIANAEAERQEVQLNAEAHAHKVKVEASANADQVRLQAAAEAERVQLEAHANAEATKQVGQAEAYATEAKGKAEGEAVRAKGMAEAEAIKARADALAENQDAVIGQQLAENWPSIVEAAAKPFGDIDQMIVLNGAQGLSDTLAQALSQGVAGLQMARTLLAGANGTNGHNTSGHSTKGASKADDEARDELTGGS